MGAGTAGRAGQGTRNKDCFVRIVCSHCEPGGSGNRWSRTARCALAVGMGGSISLSIAFISLRSPNSGRASQLSGMSQSAGYLLAAVGPVVTGSIFDATASWTIPLILFICLIVLLALCGLSAGADKTVSE